MKKFIPYILITAFIGTFLMVSFIGPFSSTTVSGPKKAEASATGEILKFIGIQALSMMPIFAVTDLVGITDTTGWGNWGAVGDATIGQMIAWISSFTWYVSSKIFTLSGYLLDYSVDFSVKDFKKNIEGIRVIDIGYGIILNVANMIFIFILLYIAIKMVLGMGGDVKKLLTNVIIVALFINFSLFMTKVFIDASNILAMGFYNAIQTDGGIVAKEGPDKGKTMIAVGSIATSMMAGLRLQTLLPSQSSSFNKTDTSKGLSNFNIAMNQFGGSAMFLVSAFVFFSVSFLFITRFIALLFYMLFSPVAFLGYISPELKEHSARWWKGFQNQLIFPPAFLFIAYIISSIINSGQLWAAVGGVGNPAATMYDAIASAGQAGSFSIIMNYVILIALMIGGLITAKAMAAQGSAGMVAYADKARGWMQGVAGRNTIGRAAYLASKSEFVNNLAAKSPTFGGFAKARLEGVADMKFVEKKAKGKGYASALKESIEKKKKMADSIAKSKTREVDESIRKEQSLVNDREMLQFDLNKAKLESEKKVNDLKNEHEVYSKLTEDVKGLEAEYQKLYAVSSRPGATPEQIAATVSANLKLGAKEGELADEGVRLVAQGVDLNRYEGELENAKIDFGRDEENLKTHKSNTAKIQKRLDNFKKQRDNIRDKMKREYAKNLPFAELGKSLWGDNLAFLDEIFPSFTDAANEIRKGKTKNEKAVLDLMKEIAAEEKEKTGP